MRGLFTFPICLTLLFLFCFLPVKAHAQLEIVENGSFETGNFTGWTVLNEGSGDWFVYSGINTPINGFAILAPPDGDFAAVTDQPGSGTHLLLQEISILPGATVTCSAVIYYNNSTNDFFVGPDLSYLTIPNQQARVDILSADADPFTVSDGVLLNIYQTQPGDLLSLGYTTLDFDLSQFAGSTVVFRAAEVDNVLFFNFAIDDVTCISEGGTANIPTLGEWGMFAMAGALGLAGFMFARRRRYLAA